jgi:hypothetical protein
MCDDSRFSYSAPCRELTGNGDAAGYPRWSWRTKGAAEMIRRPRQGNEGTAEMASRLGCTLVEAVPRHGHARPALVGCDPVLSQRMKALGARWDSFNQALAFAGWQQGRPVAPVAQQDQPHPG